MIRIPRLPWPRLAAIILLAAALLLAWHWHAGRQVHLHQQHFLETVGDRNWKKAADFLAADYRDRWGQSRAEVLQRLPQAFQDFLACGVESESESLEWKGGDGIVRARIRIVGSGGPIARFVMEEVGKLEQPFALTWRKQSWKPWDWALVSVDQPQIEIPAGDLEQL